MGVSKLDAKWHPEKFAQKESDLLADSCFFVPRESDLLADLFIFLLRDPTALYVAQGSLLLGHPSDWCFVF